jgi:hypothetical protein
VRLVICILALVLAPAAAGSGPWLGSSDGGSGVSLDGALVSYVASLHGQTTTVAAVRKSDGRVLRSIAVDGQWGIPYVTLNGGIGGLSADGRLLVLADRFQATGALRARSAFIVLRTGPFRLQTTVRLNGDFGFDALAPDGRTVYLIQHVSGQNLTSYRVRAYDLPAGRLLNRVVADKRQAGWVMNGYPVARATSAGGRWVYTLYQQGTNYPFVHALDAAHKTAVCIGLPWHWVNNGAAISNAELRLGKGRLTIVGDHGNGTRFVLDTNTLRLLGSG